MYQRDREWGDGFAEQVKTILKTLIQYCVVISVAPAEEDNKQATDFTIKLLGGSVAVRLRRPECTYRDLTIRSLRSNGAKTELAKIQEGFASRYFYGWIDIDGVIAEWILVDLDKMRDLQLLASPRKNIPNGDGTFFVAFSIKELRDAGCLLESQLNGAKSLPRPSDTKQTYTKKVKQALQASMWDYGLLKLDAEYYAKRQEEGQEA